MMDASRSRAELQALAAFFGKAARPPANWTIEADAPGGILRSVTFGVASQSGKRYTIYVPLGGFPHSVPPVYIKSPRPLRDRAGNPLTSVSASMHVLSPDSDGSTQICHFPPSQWDQYTSLVKIIPRILMWLHIYEQHLKTGRPIDQYLDHG